MMPPGGVPFLHLATRPARIARAAASLLIITVLPCVRAGMESYLGTVLTVKGHNRAGSAELAYASFLCNATISTEVLKQGWLLKRAKRSERWMDRFVALRGPFLIISHREDRQGSLSKVHQVQRVVDGQARTDLLIYPASNESRNCDNIQLRCPTVEDREQWKDAILQGLSTYQATDSMLSRQGSSDDEVRSVCSHMPTSHWCLQICWLLPFLCTCILFSNFRVGRTRALQFHRQLSERERERKRTNKQTPHLKPTMLTAHPVVT